MVAHIWHRQRMTAAPCLRAAALEGRINGTETKATPVTLPNQDADATRRGLLLGMLGIACFCLTPPATRAAVAQIDPLIVGAGRGLGAALLAAPLLLLTRQPWPARSQVPALLVIGLGVIFGFPLLSTWAMQFVPATHTAAIFGLLPLATAVVGAVRTGERPSAKFWLASGTGSVIVIAYALAQGGGRFHPADLALFGAVLAAAVGYTEGALLTRALGGWQVICWTLVLAAPASALLVAWTLHHAAAETQTVRQLFAPVSWTAWLGFGYVTVFSQFLGFFAWYRGLALGGVARVSQLQLLMPFMTIAASAFLLREGLAWPTLLTATAVVATVALGRSASIRPPRPVAAEFTQ
jgi:drug/metabolite transporter (DMT)-like permease